MNLWNHLVFWRAFELKTFLNRQWSTLNEKNKTKQKKQSNSLELVGTLFYELLFSASSVVKCTKIQKKLNIWNRKVWPTFEMKKLLNRQRPTLNEKSNSLELVRILFDELFPPESSAVKSAKIKNKKNEYLKLLSLAYVWTEMKKLLDRQWPTWNKKSNSLELVGTLYDQLLFSASSVVKAIKVKKWNNEHLKSLSLTYFWI